MHRIDPMHRERATTVLLTFHHPLLKLEKKKFRATLWTKKICLPWPEFQKSSLYGHESCLQKCPAWLDSFHYMMVYNLTCCFFSLPFSLAFENTMYTNLLMTKKVKGGSGRMGLLLSNLIHIPFSQTSSNFVRFHGPKLLKEQGVQTSLYFVIKKNFASLHLPLSWNEQE